VCKLDDETELEEIFNKWGKEIAAVIVEPLPANYGLLVQRKEFLLKIQELCKKHQSLFIADEVISGFRVDIKGMSGLLDLKPDLICYGKIIGGGFPVGCYGGKKEIMDQVAPLGAVYQAGTLSANPVGMRAGLRTLEKMKRLNGWNVLNEKGSYFSRKLKSSLESHGLQMSQEYSLFWIHEKVNQPIRSISQIPQGQQNSFKKLFLNLLQEGVYLAPNAYEVGFISMAHTDEILDETIQKIEYCLNK
jgi:glutamate-1-semialdehyde 2,1-aminomutase